MPIYEYICPDHGRFEHIEPLRGGHCEFYCAGCPVCGEISNGVISKPGNWKMGWGFLNNIKSEPAPNDAGYYPKWDD